MTYHSDSINDSEHYLCINPPSVKPPLHHPRFSKISVGEYLFKILYFLFALYYTLCLFTGIFLSCGMNYLIFPLVPLICVFWITSMFMESIMLTSLSFTLFVLLLLNCLASLYIFPFSIHDLKIFSSILLSFKSFDTAFSLF